MVASTPPLREDRPRARASRGTNRRVRAEPRPPAAVPTERSGGSVIPCTASSIHGSQRRALDEVDVDDLGGHVPGEGERGRPEGGRRPAEALPAEEQVHADQGEVVDGGERERPGAEGRQDRHQPVGRVGRTGVEPRQQRGAAEQVGVPQREHPVGEVPAGQHPEREVLEQVVAVEHGPADQHRKAEHGEGDDGQGEEDGVGAGPLPDPPLRARDGASWRWPAGWRPGRYRGRSPPAGCRRGDRDHTRRPDHQLTM